jgi:hypothetical protein
MSVVAPPPNGTRPVAPRHQRSLLGTAIQAVVLLLLLALLAGMVLFILAFASLLNVPNQVAGGVGDRLGGAAAGAARVVGGAQQALENATDPNHPPSGLAYDTEFSALQVWHVGERLPDGSTYVFTLQSIRRRDGAASPETALYAVVHAELRQPRETRLLGQLIHSDSDPHNYALYKGESFRIGRAIYRVNWVSQEDNALAAGTYRTPDAVSAALKFAYD